MTSQTDILISLKPKHAEHIFGGKKTVELRKRRPKIGPGTRICIYATSPIAAIKGYASLIQIKSAPPADIWKTWGDQSGISKNEFDSYFRNCKIAHALVLANVMLMKRALSLERIRELIEGFQPPQFFFHLNGATNEMRLHFRKHKRIKSKRRH